MTIRDDLLTLLEYSATDFLDAHYESDLTLDEIAGLILNRHAHELAEKQRAERAAWEGRAFEGGATGLGEMDRIIDLIDPEVPNGGGLEEDSDGS